MTAKKTAPGKTAKSAISAQKSRKAPLRQRDNRLKTKPAKQAAAVFVEALSSDMGRGRVTRAAQKAYPKQSVRAAVATGSRLLRHPDVQAALQKRMEAAAQHAGITRQQLVGMLTQIVFGSLNDVNDDSGKLDWEVAEERGVDHLINEVTVTDRHSKDGAARRTMAYKIPSKIQAADLLSDLMGWKKQAMANPVDSARESFEIMRRKPDYADIPDPELARLSAEAHGLPASMIPDIMAGAVKTG